MTVDAVRALVTMPSHDGPVSPRDPSFLRSILSGTLSQRQEKESIQLLGRRKEIRTRSFLAYVTDGTQGGQRVPSARDTNP